MQQSPPQVPEKTRYDRAIQYVKNHKFLAVVLIVGLIIISVGRTLDAGQKIVAFFANPKERESDSSHVVVNGKLPSTSYIGPSSRVQILRTKLSDYRAKMNLRPLRPDENELPINELPANVYGYCWPFNVDEPKAEVFQKQITAKCVEIQKHGGGRLSAIIYVGAETAALLERDQPHAGIRFTCYSAQWDQANNAMSLDIQAIARIPRTRDIPISPSETIAAMDILLK